MHVYRNTWFHLFAVCSLEEFSVLSPAQDQILFSCKRPNFQSAGSWLSYKISCWMWNALCYGKPSAWRLNENSLGGKGSLSSWFSFKIFFSPPIVLPICILQQDNYFRLLEIRWGKMHRKLLMVDWWGIGKQTWTQMGLFFSTKNRWSCFGFQRNLTYYTMKKSDAHRWIQPHSGSINQKTQAEQCTDSRSRSKHWTDGRRTALYGLCFWNWLLKSVLRRAEKGFWLITRW